MSASATPGLTRRGFLGATSAAAFLLMLESCSMGSLGRSAASPSGAGGSDRYQQALLLMRDALRASPDHLAFRATDLVAHRDATGIVEFVRDRISVVPPFVEFDDVRGARRWGTAATLRGGRGTLRERADVLADMLTRAGFKAGVMSADLPAGIGLQDLYRARVTDFAPDQGKVAAASAQLRAAGRAIASAPPAFDPGPDRVAAIMGALPASLQQAHLRQDLVPAKVPVVAFDDGGRKRYAFALGDLNISDTAPSGLGTYGDGDALRTLTVTVSAMANPAPGTATPRGRLIELVSARWAADAVVGHQVLLSFVPPQGPRWILGAGLDALPVRLPTLRLQADQAPSSAPASFTVAGPAVTMHGDVLAPAVGGQPAANGAIDGPFGAIPALADADLKKAVANASAIRASVNAAAFPQVEIDFTVTDAGGSGIDGINAASFTVKEEGQKVPGFALYSNVHAQARPRVMVVYDAKYSFGNWKSAAAENTFQTKLASVLEKLAATRAFDIQVVGLGASPDGSSWTAPKSDAILAKLKAAGEYADDPWLTAGGAALDQGVTAMVVVSDFDSLDVDSRTVAALQRLVAASRVPVFAVPVGVRNATDRAALKQVVALSGGEQLDPNDAETPAKIGALVAPLVANWVGGAYRIRYTASADGPAQRTVTIGLAGRNQPVANSTYQVPVSPVAGPSFTGLYVTIEIPGVFRSFRRIAGVKVDGGGGLLGALDDPVDVAETRAAMNGVTTIAIEPGTPTPAAVIEDAVAALLSAEPLRPLSATATPDQILSAVKAGVRSFPTSLMSMLLPANSESGAVRSLTVAIVQQRALSPAAIETHADFAVGANLLIPIATDRRAGFASALATSIGASQAEAATFDDSAYARLSGRGLTALAANDFSAYNEFFKTVPPARLALWKAMTRIYSDLHMVVPQAGAADAFWAVDPGTGAAKAVLLDGTGGAIVRETCTYDGEFAMSLMLALLSIMCTETGELYAYYCTGINTAATGMCVVQIFEGKATLPATPLSLWVGIFKPFPKNLWFNRSVGVILLLLTLSDACTD
jgi:hypothetical protein